MKKVILFVAIVIIIAGGVFLIVKNSSKSNSNESSNSNKGNQNSNTAAEVKFSDLKSTSGSDLALYVGDGCPHCSKVESYVKQNKIDEKLALDVKEVWYNKENADDLNKTAEICKIPQNDLGVPLLLDRPNSKCYVGEDEITNFLNSKANTQSNTNAQ